MMKKILGVLACCASANAFCASHAVSKVVHPIAVHSMHVRTMHFAMIGLYLSVT